MALTFIFLRGCSFFFLFLPVCLSASLFPFCLSVSLICLFILLIVCYSCHIIDYRCQLLAYSFAIPSRFKLTLFLLFLFNLLFRVFHLYLNFDWFFKLTYFSLVFLFSCCFFRFYKFLLFLPFCFAFFNFSLSFPDGQHLHLPTLLPHVGPGRKHPL